MSRTALFADGLRDSELEKSALKIVTILVIQFQSRMNKLCFFFLKKLVKEDPHTTIRENVKHVTFKLAQLEDLCAMI